MLDPNYEKRVVLSGSFRSGFQTYGPFDNDEQANRWVAENRDRLEDLVETLYIAIPQDAVEEWKANEI